jgi:hypothetical protein
MVSRAMPEDATLEDSDPHSKRMIFDTAEWHDRLARLVEIRRAHPGTYRAALDLPPLSMILSEKL